MINFCPPGTPIIARRALENVLQTRRAYQSSGRRFFYGPRCDRDTLVVPSLDRAVSLAGRPDRHRRHAAPTRGRVQEPAGGPGHHHPRRPAGLPVFAALAEFIRELIIEGTREGLDAPGPSACASAGPRP